MIKFLHTTPTANITIQLKSTLLPSSSLIKYENKHRFEDLCKLGCPNYDKKWSCPPHSPSYSKYSQSFKYCILLLLTCELSQFSYIKLEYMKIKASNTILKSQANKLASYLENALAGTMLSSGSCKLCKPCSKKNSSACCKNPLKLRYSLEALGLNVDQISTDFFDHNLKWYKNKAAPVYSSVICGVLTNVDLDSSYLNKILKNFYSNKLI